MKHPIKVLYLSLKSDMTRGGQRSLFHLVQHLDRQVCQPAVVAPETGELSRELFKIKVPSYDCPWPKLRTKELIHSPSSILRLRSILNEFEPDIIHADAPRNTHAAAAARIGLHPSKLIVHLRVANYDGLSDRFLAAETDGMIAISRGVAQRFAAFPMQIQEKMTIIYNGVDIHRFKPASQRTRNRFRKMFDIPESIPVVAFLAGYVPFKRHDFLLDLWPRVLQSQDALLLLAGAGPEEGKKLIERRVNNEGLASSVRILPFVSQPEALIAASDVLVLPSSDSREEGFGRVVIEAAACGIPSVASDIPGTREAILHGKTGFLVDPHDTRNWVEILSALLKDPLKRHEIGSRGRQWAVDRFSLERHAMEVQKYYQRLLQGEE